MNGGEKTTSHPRRTPAAVTARIRLHNIPSAALIVSELTDGKVPLYTLTDLVNAPELEIA
jgi:hypothetical protein